MFYILSKLVWALAQPLSLIFIALLFGILLLARRRHRGAAVLLSLSAVGFFFACFTNVGVLLFGALEDRFERPPLPAEVGLIIVLGGGVDGHVSASRSITELDVAGDRFVEALFLARLYPNARLLVSGGIGGLTGEGEGDAVVAQRFFVRMGIDASRLVLEGESRTTAENAELTRKIMADAPAGATLLVTSGWHMPRSMGAFRKVGINATPWPTDFRSTKGEGFSIDPYQPARNALALTHASKEWVGLVAYYLAGKSDTLIPGP